MVTVVVASWKRLGGLHGGKGGDDGCGAGGDLDGSWAQSDSGVADAGEGEGVRLRGGAGEDCGGEGDLGRADLNREGDGDVGVFGEPIFSVVGGLGEDVGGVWDVVGRGRVGDEGAWIAGDCDGNVGLAGRPVLGREGECRDGRERAPVALGGAMAAKGNRSRSAQKRCAGLPFDFCAEIGMTFDPFRLVLRPMEGVSAELPGNPSGSQFSGRIRKISRVTMFIARIMACSENKFRIY